MPLFAGVVGDTVGGLVTDWLLKKTAAPSSPRRTVAIVGLLGCAIFIVPAAMRRMPTPPSLPDRSHVFLECTIGPLVGAHGCGGKYPDRVRDDEHGRQYRGALSPLVFGFCPVRNWQAPFIVAASLLVAGAAVWAFWLDPDRSVVERDAVPVAAAAAAAV